MVVASQWRESGMLIISCFTLIVDLEQAHHRKIFYIWNFVAMIVHS